MFSTQQITDAVDICVDLNINIEQYFFCMMLKDNRVHELYRYITEARSEGLPKSDLLDLEEKGYVICYDNSDPTPDNYTVTDEFIEKVYNIRPKQSGEEAWDAYPRFIRVDGKKFSARTANKEQWIDTYARRYGRFVQKHKKIMSAIKYGRENKLITCGIQKFLDSELWDSLIVDMKEAKKPRIAPAHREV